MTDLVAKIRTWQLIAYTDGWVDGELKDWPANLSDVIYGKIETLSHAVALPLTVVHSRCDVDWGDTRAQDRHFVHIIVSEIVAGFNDSERDAMIKAAVQETLRGKSIQ